MDKEEPQTINSVDFSDISFAEYNTIAELTHSLCHVDGFERRHKKHVKYDQLQQWRQTLLDRMKPMIDLYSQSAAMFLPWLSQDAFHAMLFDYSFYGEEASDTIENALGNMFELLYEEIQGRDIFKGIFEDSLSQLDIIKNEGSNLNIEDISRRFNEKNWFTVCFYVARKRPVGFSKILSPFSTIISMKKRSTPIESFTHIIDHRFTNNLVSITNAKLAAYHNRYVNITVWKEAMSKRYPGCTFYTARENEKLVQYVGYESVEINQGRIAALI